MLRDIYVHGAAAKATGGRHFRLDVASPGEAVRALLTLHPDLRPVIRQGTWRMVVGPPHVANAVPLPCIGMNMGGQPLHLVPATGAAGGDTGKIVAGVVLVGAAIVLAPWGAGLAAGTFAATGIFGVSYASVALLGGSMILAGVSGLLTQPPQAQQNQQATDMARPEDRPSFLFNGVTNNSQQGGPVPLVFGTHLVGSVVIGGGIEVEDIAI